MKTIEYRSLNNGGLVPPQVWGGASISLCVFAATGGGSICVCVYVCRHRCRVMSSQRVSLLTFCCVVAGVA